MQKAKIKFFKDRSVFYTTFPIREQAEKGDWNFKLKPIYCVAILDFKFDEDRDDKHYVSDVQLKDQSCRVFYNKLRYIFIEMPRFNKKEDELKTRFDKWMYFLKHLEDFEEIPAILNEEVFVKGFEVAEIANFDYRQMMEYEDSLKVYRDLKGVVDTSFEEGEKIGMEKGEKKRATKMAEIMKNEGKTIEKIMKYTGFSREEVEKL